MPSDFECEKRDFADYLASSAAYDQLQRMGRLYWALHKDKVVGYMMMAMDRLNKDKQEKLGIDSYGHIPALSISLLAVDKRYEGRGIGSFMVQWGRDLSAAEGRSLIRPRCWRGRFNGAATSRPRKGPRPHDAQEAAAASMGPRPLGRGRPDRRPARRLKHAASMGPRPLGRGRGPAIRFHVAASAASMGPRPLGRGRRRRRRGRRRSPWLQWGRDLSAAEGRPALA